MELVQLVISAFIGIYACYTLKQIQEDIGEFHNAACTRLEVIKNLTALSVQSDIDQTYTELSAQNHADQNQAE